MKLSFVLFSTLLATGTCYTIPTRRQLLQQVTTGAVAAAFLLPSSAQAAIEACPPKSQNCIRTTWTPPPSTSKSDMASTLTSILDAYPQDGQGGIDNKGWSIAEGSLADTGRVRVEYQNYGNFAKFLNGGKPFVDDLVVELTPGAAEVRSSARLGDSDLGVNQKRLQYLGAALKAKGWSVPDPTY